MIAALLAKAGGLALGLWGNIWVKIALAAVVAAAIGGTYLYIGKLRAERDLAVMSVERLTEVNARTVESFHRYQAEQERARAALVRAAESAAPRASERAAHIQRAENGAGARLAGPVTQRGFQRSPPFGRTH